MNVERRDFAPHTVRVGWQENGHRVAMVVAFGLHHLRGNSSPYFSITADGYIDGRWSFGGCCHDEIAQRLPDLSDVIALHLSDMDGAPMHASSNAWYWLAGVVDVGEQYHGGSGSSAKGAMECLRIFANHVRLPEKEAHRIIGHFARMSMEGKRRGPEAYSESRKRAKLMFARWIDEQRPRWKAEANALIRKYGLGIYGDMHKTPAEVEATLH